MQEKNVSRTKRSEKSVAGPVFVQNLHGLLGRRQLLLLSASFLWAVHCMSRSLRTAALFSQGTQEGTDRISLLLLKT